jgi:hypothetical protein
MRETGISNCPLHFAKMRGFQGIREKRKSFLSTHGGTDLICDFGFRIADFLAAESTTGEGNCPKVLP